MFPGDELIPRLRELYHAIDSAYCDAAESMGFGCTGCDGVKCCTVDLNLHTLIEMLYLRRGFNALDETLRQQVLRKSYATVEARKDNALGEAYRNSVCALNVHGGCVVYEYRPIICRLAGIPHYIVRPDGKTIESGGCDRYKNDIEPVYPNMRIDRTDFYKEMASIEIEVVRARGKRTSSHTVAETLCLSEHEFA
jgi:Fe-S-cluster containining protein